MITQNKVQIIKYIEFKNHNIPKKWARIYFSIRIKGGIYVILNYLVTMLLMGISLALTIKDKMPIIISGVPLPQAPMKIEHSDLTLKTWVAGFGVSVSMPGNQVSKCFFFLF